MTTTRTGRLAGTKTLAFVARTTVTPSITATGLLQRHSAKLSRHLLTRHLLTGAAVLALLAGASALPAQADGGNGGASTSTQGNGGVSDPTANPPTIDGQANPTGGGGGGGAGIADGGDGGGSAGGSAGGGGGGGAGVNLDMSTVDVTNGSVVTGGNGGHGGDSPANGGVGGNGRIDGVSNSNGGTGGNGSGSGTGSGGGGGAGGYGGVITNTSAGNSLTNNGAYTGGNGGAGGAATTGFDGGGGGDGGVGLQFTSGGGALINNSTATITGGDGGVGGHAAGGVAGDGGQGGEGVNGHDLVIENGGEISGGMGADGTRADAIHFTSGSNALFLAAGSQIIGNVVNDGTTGQLVIETNGSNNSSFDVSQIGAIGSSSQYQGFNVFAAVNSDLSQGVGTVTLTGTTTEALAWGVDDNTIVAISSDSNLGAAGSTIQMDGGTLQTTADIGLSHDVTIDSTSTNSIDTMTHTVTVSGHITGASTLAWHKLGTGTLIIDSVSSGFFGTTDVDAGTLEVGDVNHPDILAQLGGHIVVNAGGTLSGYGSLADVTNADGIVAPGGPGMSDADAGTLNVNSYTPSANSTLRILLTPNANSLLAVGGPAVTHLDGKLDLVFAPGVYAADNRTILTADNGYDGSFASITSNASFSTTVNTTDPQNVSVDLAGGSISGGTTVAPSDGHVIGAATGSLVAGTQIATQSLFDHLSDQRSGSEDDALHTAFAGSNPAQAAFAGDMAALNNIVACLPQALAKNGGWFRGLGGFGNIDSSNGAPGVDSYGGGFMAGYDRALTDHLLLGIAAGYTRTAIQDDDNSSATIDTPRVSLYGSYHLGGFALDSSVGYAFDRIKSQDQSDGGDAKSKRDANEINAALQASYNVNLPDAVVLTPHAGLDYLHIFEDGFNEHGAGAFDLQADSNNTDSLRPQVGAGISRSFAADNGWHLIPAVDLTYSREVLDNKHDANVVAGGGNFNIKGVTPSRDQLALNVDLTAQLNDSVDLSLGYTDVLPVGNTASYNFTGGVHVLF